MSTPPCTCPTCGSALIDDGTIRYDQEAGIAVARGFAAQFTRQEAALFEALWDAKPRILDKEQLLRATADYAADDRREIKIVDVFICKVRKKLEPLGVEIGTVWGKGYRIVGGRSHE